MNTPDGCRLCATGSLRLIRHSNITDKISSDDFAITDSNYGVTLPLYECDNCGFIQASEDVNTLDYYCSLEDPSYDENRKERSLQQVKLLELLKRFKPEGRLLDIGAASGILVEQARRLGFDAQGIEPCKYLQQQAADLGLPVSLNVFPYEGLESDYGVITMVDVIEHVPNPRELFEGAYDHLKAGGLLLVVTPNVRSFCATIMKWKWWHYRVAHIGYFSDKNMRMLINDTGFEVVHDSKPGWFFSLDYLVGRLNKYLPAAIQLPIPACFQKITVPLNLFDSMLFICRKRS